MRVMDTDKKIFKPISTPSQVSSGGGSLSVGTKNFLSVKMKYLVGRHEQISCL